MIISSELRAGFQEKLKKDAEKKGKKTFPVVVFKKKTLEYQYIEYLESIIIYKKYNNFNIKTNPGMPVDEPIPEDILQGPSGILTASEMDMQMRPPIIDDIILVYLQKLEKLNPEERKVIMMAFKEMFKVTITIARPGLNQ